MAAGRPVVASAVDGVREALGDTGVVVEPGDLRGLSAAVSSLLADPAAAIAAGLAARQRVTVVGDLRQSVKAWDGLLVGLLTETADPGNGADPARPLMITPVTGVARALAGGALASADIAVVDGHRSADAARASALSALGVPVWWRGDGRSTPPALGAPVLDASATSEEMAEAARRPGAAPGRPRPGGGPLVSIVVTVLNEGPALERLVRELLDQLTPGDELVIVDGGSTDGSVDGLAAAEALRVHVVAGAGISAGRNHGIAAPNTT
jgi:hypothetical protein